MSLFDGAGSVAVASRFAGSPLAVVFAFPFAGELCAAADAVLEGVALALGGGDVSMSPVVGTTTGAGGVVETATGGSAGGVTGVGLAVGCSEATLPWFRCRPVA